MKLRPLPLLLIAVVLTGLVSCDAGIQGNMNENLPPRTFLTVDEIRLDGDPDDPDTRRLVSQVLISWWGDDPDGYVTGFEFAITDREWIYAPENEGEVDWVYTRENDSLFVLPIPPGEKVADVRFTVRAIDNEGARDPVGASVVFPIENSPPVIELHKTTTPQRQMEVPPDTTFHIASFGWTASDPDGDDNLSHYEVVMNDTLASWLRIPVDVSFMAFRIEQPAGNQTSASVYLGRSFTSSGLTLENLRMNSENTLYIRAVDNADAVSPIDSVSWYLKEQQSRILFVNDYPGSLGQAAIRFHQELLETAGITNYDMLHVIDGTASGGRKVPMSSAFHLPVDPTMIRILAEWDHIYWVSGDLDRNITYALRSTIDFFANGGTMFVNIPTKRMQEEDAIFDFLPISAMKPVPAGQTSYQVQANATLAPIDEPQLDTLVVRRGSQSAFPVEPLGDARTLYELGFLTRPFFTPVQGAIAVAAQDNSIIYFGYPMDWLQMGPELNRATETMLNLLNFPKD